MKAIKWTIKDIVDILQTRQANEFDGNIAVSGDRGNGKSTVINKIVYRFKCFKPWKHQVYTRDDVIKLLKTQTYGLCWDDEAINSSYKRSWQDKGQQELITILTAYRDNYNVFASAIPNFFSLDKDLRDLYFLHLHVIERGIAVVHMPLQGRLYSQDRWDSKYNAKIEESWSKKMQKNPDFKPPYHKLSTFRGYLFFTDVTDKQKELYKQIKREKKKEAFQTKGEETAQISFIQKVYQMVVSKKLTKEGLLQACQIEGKKYSRIVSTLNQMLKDDGHPSLSTFLVVTNEENNNKTTDLINNIIPDI